jgi:hypothetical protein
MRQGGKELAGNALDIGHGGIKPGRQDEGKPCKGRCTKAGVGLGFQREDCA